MLPPMGRPAARDTTKSVCPAAAHGDDERGARIHLAAQTHTGRGAPPQSLGVRGKLIQAARGSDRLHAASNARSARVSRGRAASRRSTASSCRRTRISSSFERRGRASNPHQREQVPRDQIRKRPEQAPLPRPRPKSTNLASRQSPAEFANPTRGNYPYLDVTMRLAELPLQTTEPVVLQGLPERMMGLEPTTFCMASP
jgi:hypothetical protein